MNNLIKIFAISVPQVAENFKLIFKACVYQMSYI